MASVDGLIPLVIAVNRLTAEVGRDGDFSETVKELREGLGGFPGELYESLSPLVRFDTFGVEGLGGVSSEGEGNIVAPPLGAPHEAMPLHGAARGEHLLVGGGGDGVE